MPHIHALTKTVDRSGFVARLRPGAQMRAVNDNYDEIGGDELLRETLRFFAEHGLGAAGKARDNAQASFFAGDRKTYRRWLAICRALDQRMANAVAYRLSQPARDAG